MIGIMTVASGSWVRIEQSAKSDLRQAETRVSRVATLDGGVVLSHYGFAHGDRTLQVRGEISAADAATLETIQQNHTTVWIAAADGFYSGVIRALQTDGGSLRMTLWLSERLD